MLLKASKVSHTILRLLWPWNFRSWSNYITGLIDFNLSNPKQFFITYWFTSMVLVNVCILAKNHMSLPYLWPWNLKELKVIYLLGQGQKWNIHVCYLEGVTLNKATFLYLLFCSCNLLLFRKSTGMINFDTSKSYASLFIKRTIQYFAKWKQC